MTSVRAIKKIPRQYRVPGRLSSGAGRRRRSLRWREAEHARGAGAIPPMRHALEFGHPMHCSHRRVFIHCRCYHESLRRNRAAQVRIHTDRTGVVIAIVSSPSSPAQGRRRGRRVARATSSSSRWASSSASRTMTNAWCMTTSEARRWPPSTRVGCGGEPHFDRRPKRSSPILQYIAEKLRSPGDEGGTTPATPVAAGPGRSEGQQCKPAGARSRPSSGH